MGHACYGSADENSNVWSIGLLLLLYIHEIENAVANYNQFDMTKAKKKKI